MGEFLTLFASATAEESSGGIFGSLGIDWKILILQMIAFGILVFILSIWVYPPILAMLDRRDKLIDDSVKAAKEASKQSEKAAEEVAEQLKAARDEANSIVSSAREQSTQMLIDSEKEADRRAESLVSSAKAQLERDVEAARQALRAEAASLVALATEKVIDEKVDTTADSRLIATALTDVEKSRKGRE